MCGIDPAHLGGARVVVIYYDTSFLGALYITNSKPTCCQFEAWIKQQPGVRLDAASIAKLNDSIRGYNHDEGTVTKSSVPTRGLSERSSFPGRKSHK
jgi:hypothetical protein